jgi:hypothetical protein
MTAKLSFHSALLASFMADFYNIRVSMRSTSTSTVVITPAVYEVHLHNPDPDARAHDLHKDGCLFRYPR